ncbi:hypothetical protein LSAT2_017478 [Lamellibrachia satsuma]|nr:hypothetical protein LSAT2_017478 [Lamellibrachia satsuma]
MSSNFLKLNDDKTEVIIFGSRQQLKKIELQAVHIGDSLVSVSHVRNLGVQFDETRTMESHITASATERAALAADSSASSRYYFSYTERSMSVHRTTSPTNDGRDAHNNDDDDDDDHTQGDPTTTGEPLSTVQPPPLLNAAGYHGPVDGTVERVAGSFRHRVVWAQSLLITHRTFPGPPPCTPSSRAGHVIVVGEERYLEVVAVREVSTPAAGDRTRRSIVQVYSIVH